MLIIVGLGNPGEKYINTWHNIGFQFIDRFQEINNFPAFRFSKKFQAEISESKIANKKIILVKPQTFMNESGRAVKKIFKFKISIFNKFLIDQFSNNLFVIHDDIDLPLGKIRIVKNRGAAGHKGVESIIDKLKTKNFIRIRIGISTKAAESKNAERFVLQKFGEEEKKIIKEIIEKTVKEIEFILRNGLKKGMNEYNK